jgi:hypothetical protein
MTCRFCSRGSCVICPYGTGTGDYWLVRECEKAPDGWRTRRRPVPLRVVLEPMPGPEPDPGTILALRMPGELIISVSGAMKAYAGRIAQARMFMDITRLSLQVQRDAARGLMSADEVRDALGLPPGSPALPLDAAP